jgi:Co/Zn/Cd efflux system component
MTAVKAWPILWLLLFITAAESFFSTVANDSPNVAMMALIGLAFNFVSFVWYCRDSDAAAYRRTLGLNIAVILLGPFAIAYYLLRSRPKGFRLRAMLRLLGFIVLVVLASVVGTLAGAVIA